MLTKYDDDGLCILTTNDGKSLTLYTSGKLEVSEFDEGGVYETVEMQLPNWLASAIRTAFSMLPK